MRTIEFNNGALNAFNLWNQQVFQIWGTPFSHHSQSANMTDTFWNNEWMMNDASFSKPIIPLPDSPAGSKFKLVDLSVNVHLVMALLLIHVCIAYKRLVKALFSLELTYNGEQRSNLKSPFESSLKPYDPDLTYQGHWRSHLTSPLNNSDMISYDFQFRKSSIWLTGCITPKILNMALTLSTTVAHIHIEII